MNDQIETRFLDHAGVLHEEQMQSVHLLGPQVSLGALAPALAANLIEGEMKTLVQQVQAASVRIDELEKKLVRLENPAARQTSKSAQPKKRKQTLRKS